MNKIRPWRNVWGGQLPVVFDSDLSDENKMKNTLRGLRRPPNNRKTRNSKPKDSVRDGGGFVVRCNRGALCGGDDLTMFGAANEATKI